MTDRFIKALFDDRCMAPFCNAIATVNDDPFFFCDAHHDALVASLQQSGFPASASQSGTAVVASPPVPSGAATATNSVTA